MATSPITNKGDWFFSLTADATIALTEFRNESSGKAGRLIVAEVGYALLVVASAVETVVRTALTSLVTVLFVVSIPLTGLWVDSFKEDLFSPDKNTMFFLPTIGLLTTAMSGNQILCNTVALIQNLAKGKDKIDLDEDLTFASLCDCSKAADQKQTV